MAPPDQPSPPRTRALVLAWVGLLGLWAWLASPLWRTLDRVFVGRLATDGVVTPWFYDLVARELAEGRIPQTLGDFDWPAALPRTKEFPAVADAVLAAPLAWLVGWPGQWNLTLCLALLLAALGAAAVARVAGAGPVGMVVAGGLALTSRPLWADFVMARMNVAFPGLALLALAAMLASVPPSPRDPWALPDKPVIRGAFAVLGALLGALAALVYPPFLLLFAPVALILLPGALRHGGWTGPLGPLLAVLGGLALAWTGLAEIAANPGAVPDCETLECLDRYHSVAAADLALWEPIPRDGLALSGLQAAHWLLLPLVLLHRRRLAGVGLVAVGLLLADLALGPCPRWSGEQAWSSPVLDAVAPLLAPLRCPAAHLHDYGRFASALALLWAVLSGLGLGALEARGRLGSLVAMGLGAGVLVLSLRVLGPEVLAPKQWQDVPVPSSVAFLETHEAGPVAELPYDRQQQFLSVLWAPGSPRANPLKPRHQRHSRSPSFAWLDALARGELETGATESPGSRSALAATGLRWVLFDPTRCGHHAPAAACSEAVKNELSSVLGPPGEGEQGLLWWDLQAPQSSDATQPAQEPEDRLGGGLDRAGQGSAPPEPEPSQDHQ